MILELIWALWSELPAHGRKAAQFVDLLGYFSLLRSEEGPTDEGKLSSVSTDRLHVSFALHDIQTLFHLRQCENVDGSVWYLKQKLSIIVFRRTIAPRP